MNPLARREGWSLTHIDGTPTFLHEGLQHTAEVHPVTAKVWELADGARTVAEITATVRAELDANTDNETVFQALDALADHGLLLQRAAPPAGVSRRSLLRGLAGFSALAATGSVTLKASTAFAAGDPCASEKKDVLESAKIRRADEKKAKALQHHALKAGKQGATKASDELSAKAKQYAQLDYRNGSDLSYDEGEVDQCGADRITEFQLRNREKRAKYLSHKQKAQLSAKEKNFKQHDGKLAADEKEHKTDYKKNAEAGNKAQAKGDAKSAKELNKKASTHLKRAEERSHKRNKRTLQYKKQEHSTKA